MDTGKYNAVKTVRITEHVHERLDALRGKDETYNTVIDRVLAQVEAKLGTSEKE